MVGKGAFGNAVLYRRKDDGLMCIIKEINMLDLNASDRQMALNEVKVLAKMDHPNIVAYHDSFEKDGILMIEMEYADGGNLAEFLGKQTVRLEEKDILDILYQMVSAIRYMHAHHVLHRDLKTANIFLTKEGTVKIGMRYAERAFLAFFLRCYFYSTLNRTAGSLKNEIEVFYRLCKFFFSPFSKLQRRSFIYDFEIRGQNFRSMDFPCK